ARLRPGTRGRLDVGGVGTRGEERSRHGEAGPALEERPPRHAPTHVLRMEHHRPPRVHDPSPQTSSRILTRESNPPPCPDGWAARSPPRMPEPALIDTRALAALAERAARAAGALLLEHAALGAVGVESKSSATDMVSEADRASEELLVDLLGAERPDDGMIGEEGTARAGTSGLTWVCDPLDGTTNYLYAFPQWAVSVAVEDADGPVAACVFDPSRDEAFTAARDHGAMLNGEPIRVSEARDLATSLIGTGFAYQ